MTTSKISISIIVPAYNEEKRIVKCLTRMPEYCNSKQWDYEVIVAEDGFTELSFVGFMTKSGIELSVATSVIIMIRLLGIWFATLLGFITTKYFFSK